MFTTPKLRFRLRFVKDEENGGGAGDNPPEKQSQDGDLGFPADTPVSEMTAEQQAAYWKHQSRKHEKRARPKNFDEIEADAQKWRDQQEQNQTPDEKALNAAKSAGRTEGAATLLHDAVRAELKAARPHMTTEALDEFLEDVALDRFLGEDGRLDTDRVARLADKLASPDSKEDDKSSQQPNGGQALGLVLSRTQQPKKGGEGSVEYFRQQEAARYAPKPNK